MDIYLILFIIFFIISGIEFAYITNLKTDIYILNKQNELLLEEARKEFKEKQNANKGRSKRTYTKRTTK